MAVIRPPLPQLAFTMIPNAWVRDPHLDPNAFRILAVILSHAEGYRLGTAQIMRQTGIGRDGVDAALDRMLARGYLVSVEQRQGERGRFAENDYTVTSCTDRVPPIPDEPAKRGRKVGIGPQRSDPATEAQKLRVPDDPEKTGQKVRTGPQRSQPGPASPATEEDKREKTKNYPPLSLPLPGEEAEAEAAAAPPRKPPAAAGFDDFWAAYPKKVGKDAARRAWARAVKRSDPDKIVAICRRYPWRDERQFVKDPSRWLNEGCWEDDLEAVAAANASRSNGHRPAAQPYRDPPRDSGAYTVGPI